MIFFAVLLMFCADDVTPDQQAATELAKVRRIYVDLLSGGQSAMRIRDMLISSLQASKQFLLTEDPEKADAVLKGSGQDEAFKDSHASSDSISVHSQISLPGMRKSDTTTSQKYSDRSNIGVSAGENESERSEERKHEAVAALRLVNKEGDVIWSATEESMGGKFLGASADVVDRITKRLVADYKQAKRPNKDKAADERR